MQDIRWVDIKFATSWLVNKSLAAGQFYRHWISRISRTPMVAWLTPNETGIIHILWQVYFAIHLVSCEPLTAFIFNRSRLYIFKLAYFQQRVALTVSIICWLFVINRVYGIDIYRRVAENCGGSPPNKDKSDRRNILSRFGRFPYAFSAPHPVCNALYTCSFGDLIFGKYRSVPLFGLEGRTWRSN